MKNLYTILLLLSTATFSFAQTTSGNNCCSQIITTKTNNPFDCLRQPAFSYYTQIPPGTVIIANNPYLGKTYGYQGQLVRVFTVYPPANSRDLPISYVVVNDACQIVCSWSDCCGVTGQAVEGCKTDFAQKAILINGF